jgi:protein-S-isoprenylcysteine O-methyltransferase Ste14
METERKAMIFNGFGILASLFIIFSGPLFSQVKIYLLVQIFSLLLIVWAVITIKVTKTHHKYNLPKGYFFIQHGPYEIIRHPIYAGYFLIMISFVEMEFTFLRLFAMAILCVVLLFKIIREEYTMTHKIHEYKEYKLKTRAIIPYLL